MIQYLYTLQYSLYENKYIPSGSLQSMRSLCEMSYGELLFNCSVNLSSQRKTFSCKQLDLLQEWGEVSPALFRKLEKSALIWGKNALIVVIYGLNFSFKMQFFRVSRQKNRRFLPCVAFLSGAVVECLSKCPNFEKTPLPEKNPGYAHGATPYFTNKTFIELKTFFLYYRRKRLILLYIFQLLNSTKMI